MRTYTYYVMVMIIIHIADITCLVTQVAWHAYGVMGSIRYITELVGSHILQNRQYCGWMVRSWARSGTVTINGASNTVVGKHGYGRGRSP